MNRNILMPIMNFMTSYYHNSYRPYRTISVPSVKIKITAIIALVCSVFVLVSCTEKSTMIGSGLLPGSDFVNVRSTNAIGITSYTNYTDSVNTTNKSFLFLGGLQDPYFGSDSLDFVSQLRILKKWVGGEPPVVDSVKLFITISGAKGVLGQPYNISLYEIDEMLYSDTLHTYYSNRDVGSVHFLCGISLPLVTKDTIQDLRMLVANSLGDRLLLDSTKLNQEGGPNDFRSYFKGLYVKIYQPLKSAFMTKGSGNNMLMAVKVGTNSFVIRVYYHTYKVTGVYYDFVINSNSARYNRYFHNLATADPDKKIKHINDNGIDTLSYMQGFNGVFTKIVIPGLAQYRDSGNISVNKAKITVPVFFDNVTYKTDTVPSIIYLKYKGADGIYYVVTDYLISPSFFGGTYSTTTKSYSFNISSFVQQYLEKKIALPELEMYFPESQYQNVILKANNSHNPVKFEFTYTKF